MGPEKNNLLLKCIIHGIIKIQQTKYLYSWKLILPGQAHSFTPFFNAKFPWSIWSPQRRKPFIGNWRSTSYKLQQTKASFVVKSVDSRPEPNNHRMSVMVSWPVIQNNLKHIFKLLTIINLNFTCVVILLYRPYLYSVFLRQSATSISAVPAITNSSSLASNTANRRESTTS